MEAWLKEIAHQIAVLAPKVALGLLILSAFWFASSVLRKFIIRISEKADFNTCFILRLAGRIGAIALIVLGAVTALGTMGIDVSALVAGLGLTGFALGFAFRDMLSNFLAGVLILLYRPFELNDYIAVAGFEGTVIEIDLRYTTLQGTGKKFLIPNSALLTNSISLVEGARAQPAEQDVAASPARPVVNR